MTEIERCSTDDIASQVQKEIAFRLLERFCKQEGAPLSLNELQMAIEDVYPDFDQEVLQAAAQANCRAHWTGRWQGVWQKLKFIHRQSKS